MAAGSSMNGRLKAHHRLAGSPDGEEGIGIGVGLQLLRASNLTMTRLHLALQRGDRRRAMRAMDGLLEIDAEIEELVAQMPRAPGVEEQHEALRGYVAHQKAALASEKHALSGMVARTSDEEPPMDAPARHERPYERTPYELNSLAPATTDTSPALARALARALAPEPTSELGLEIAPEPTAIETWLEAGPAEQSNRIAILALSLLALAIAAVLIVFIL